MSGLCLGAYLVSYIFDSIFYDVLKSHVERVVDRIPYFFIMVPLVVIYSLALSFVIKYIEIILHAIKERISGR